MDTLYVCCIRYGETFCTLPSSGSAFRRVLNDDFYFPLQWYYKTDSFTPTSLVTLPHILTLPYNFLNVRFLEETEKLMP